MWNKSFKESLKEVFRLAVYCFAFVGFMLVSVYVAVKLGLTNEKGVIDNQRANFLEAVTSVGTTSNSPGLNSSDLSLQASNPSNWALGEE